MLREDAIRRKRIDERYARVVVFVAFIHRFDFKAQRYRTRKLLGEDDFLQIGRVFEFSLFCKLEQSLLNKYPRK